MRKAGDIIMAMFRDRFGPEFMETARSTAGLFSSWTQVVAEVWSRDRGRTEPGDIPAAAVHSRIRELERGVLLVEADHPGWIQILQTKQAELLSVVQRRYPGQGIRGIAFRLSREPFSPPVPVLGDMAMPDARISQSKQEEREYLPREVFPRECLPTHPAVRGRSAGRDAQDDEEFYAALKGLEESIKERNKL